MVALNEKAWVKIESSSLDPNISSIWKSLSAYFKGENGRYKKRLDFIDQCVSERRRDAILGDPEILDNRELQFKQGKSELARLVLEMAGQGLHYLPTYKVANLRLNSY